MNEQANLSKKFCNACKKEMVYSQKNKPKQCPNCKSKYYDKPEDERFLFEVQDEFFASGRNPEVLGKMYPVLLEYTSKIISTLIRGKLHLEQEEIEQKAHDAVSKVFEYYIEKPEFKMESSFGGYMKFPSLYILFGNKKEEDHESLDFMIDDDKDFYTNIEKYGYSLLEEHEMDIETKFIDKDYNIVLDDIMNDIIKQSFKTIKKNWGLATAYYVIYGFYMMITEKDFDIHAYYQIHSNDIKRMVESLKLIVLDYLNTNLRKDSFESVDSFYTQYKKQIEKEKKEKEKSYEEESQD